MTTDGHLEMFFFPLNHNPNDFSGLQRGKLNALCTPFLIHTAHASKNNF